MRYFWSAIFIVVGVVLVGASFGKWETNVLWSFWRYWPLIIIFAGLDILTYHSKWQPLIMLVALVLAGLFIYDTGIAAKSYLGHIGTVKGNGNVVTSKVRVDRNEEAKSAKIKVETGAVEFDVSGTTDHLIDGTLVSTITGMNSTDKLTGDVQEVNLSNKPGQSSAWFWLGPFKNNLNLAFSDKLPLDLTVESGASTMDLNLEQYILSALKINTGATTLNIRLGEKVVNGAKVTVEAGASTVKISVPKNVGVRLLNDSGLSTSNFQGFTKVDNAYENAAYSTAEKKIEISLKTGASTLDVVQY